MKAILKPYAHEQEWCDEFFPDSSLCALPVAGKPFAEYLVDLCSDLKIADVLLLDYNYNPLFNDSLRNGEKWNLNLSYTGAGLSVSLPRLVAENAAFAGDDPVLIVWGARLPNPAAIDNLLADTEPVDDPEHATDGVYLWQNGSFSRSRVPLIAIDTLADYFELNFQLLRQPGIHVLPGYSAENGVYTGMNVVIKPEVHISAPVMLCDDIRLENACRLLAGTVIGNNVMVDEGTELRHSVILDHTYVGRKLEFSDKIIASHRIIDPFTATCVDLEDLGISADMNKFHGLDFQTVWEYLLAIAAVLALTIPAILLWPLKKCCPNHILCHKFSIDRYPALWNVLIGRKRLIKYTPDDENCPFRAGDADAMAHSEREMEMDDTLYRHNRTPFYAFSIVFRSLLNRLLSHASEP